MLTETRVQTPFPWLLAAHQGAPTRRLIQHPPAEPALYDRAEALLERSSWQFVPLPYLGTMPLFGGHRLYEGQVADWILVNLAEDLLLHDKDGFPLPERVMKHLWAVGRAGIEFDALYVAHETEKGRIQPGEPLTWEVIEPPPPRAVVHLSDRLAAASETIWSAAKAPLRLAKVGSRAIVDGAVAVAPVVALADPLLLGTIITPGRAIRVGEPACWFSLGAWIYGEES
jgi:hypothetical protein